MVNYIRGVDKLYALNSISPLLYQSIREFLFRKGKRVRPILFVIGYRGFSKGAAQGLYRTAISLELLHDFFLVHDDIIDKSLTRRGQPSMHQLLNKHLTQHKNLKFSGEDLAIVVGDVLYAMALDAFLAIKEDMLRKEAALQKLIQAALYTCSGEFIELTKGIAPIEKITKEDIYKIYDLKTANYTFVSPLSIGATLAGADKKQLDILYKYGIALGRAFQIKDDIIGIFSSESKIGKPNLTDLQEGKKTILIWQAYKNSGFKERHVIKDILSKKRVTRYDLDKIRSIIRSSGALQYTKNEVRRLLHQAKETMYDSTMASRWKNILESYTCNLLEVN